MRKVGLGKVMWPVQGWEQSRHPLGWKGLGSPLQPAAPADHALPPPGLVSEPPGQVPPQRAGHAGQPFCLPAQVLQPGGRHRAAGGSPAHRPEPRLSLLDGLVPLQVRARPLSGQEGPQPGDPRGVLGPRLSEHLKKPVNCAHEPLGPGPTRSYVGKCVNACS